MGMQAEQPLCSYGLYCYYRHKHCRPVKQNEEVFININNTTLIDDCKSCIYDSTKAVFEISLYQFSVFITIKNSNFSNLSVDSNILHIHIASSLDVIVSFYECNFVSNNISTDLINIWHNVPCTVDPVGPRHIVIFHKSLFSYTRYKYDKSLDVSLLSFTIFSTCLNLRLNVNFSNAMFYKNQLTLLKVATISSCDYSTK